MPAPGWPRPLEGMSASQQRTFCARQGPARTPPISVPRERDRPWPSSLPNRPERCSPTAASLAASASSSETARSGYTASTTTTTAPSTAPAAQLPVSRKPPYRRRGCSPAAYGRSRAGLGSSSFNASALGLGSHRSRATRAPARTHRLRPIRPTAGEQLSPDSRCYCSAPRSWMPSSSARAVF
jgi:hypothetical protein